ncbi:glucuronyl esterase domain-containing protein [Membranihabitans marinus]|uniref:glucuronyl esterase domain-containing protein n=1 Tax=Membranihabitans marinus TaxID=1227546 RepID=UPI001F33D10D|nr:hypothetical protein [Membranihabitans marinus]
MNKSIQTTLAFCLFLFSVQYTHAQKANYDEAKVPKFDIVDVLSTTDGQKVNTVEAWEKIRRPEILDIFRQQMYGTQPDTEVKVHYVVVKDIENAIPDLADIKEVDMIFSNANGRHSVRLTLFIPRKVSKPAPMFLGLNFYGNHTANPNENISIHSSWVRDNANFHIFGNRADEVSRGVRSSRWPVEYIVSQGYGLGLIYYGDIDPDFDDGFQNGLHPLFYKDGQTKPTSEEWGSIGIWSYGLSKALDYLGTDNDIDENKVIVFGHSRLGKTSLWAGVTDPRFAAAISNDSGCGGAALSKREFGERVAVINQNFPHWFNDNFIKYNNKESELPFDQHMLISLMAPRPVYIASAEQDEWADPKGEYLSGYYAKPAYDLYGIPSLNDVTPPKVNEARFTPGVSYHKRSGKHDVTRYDWVQYIEFADRFVR